MIRHHDAHGIRRSLAAIWAGVFLVSAGCLAAPQTIRNDQFWKDASGNLIYSQGGGVFKFGNTWYWYGAHYAGAETYAASPTKPNSDTRFVSVSCYASTDLVNWRFEANVVDSGDEGFSGTTWMGRLGVAYNKTTRKYVLVSQRNGTGGDGELFATSSTPTGKFAFDHVQATLPNVANGMSGDQTIFLDDDGTAYLVCSSKNGRGYLYVAPLRAADYLAVESAVQVAKTPGREGNCMFKYRGRYYIASSDLHGWNASHTYLQSATGITGTYATETVMGNTDMDFSHVSQTGFFFRVDGTKDTTVVFAGDRWSDFAGNGLGYNQWMPLSFDGAAAPSMNSVTEWTLDAQTGSWAVGAGNNWILNPGFEADRVVQASLAGWTDSTDQATFPGGNVAGGHAGRFALEQTSAVACVAKQSQRIVGLPKGPYSLAGWVRSSGGQKSAVLYARTSSGVESIASIASTIADWKRISIGGIAVSDGRLEVGVRSDANPGNWVRVDDLSLVQDPSTMVAADESRCHRPDSRLVLSSQRIALEAREELDVYGPSGARLGRVQAGGRDRSLQDLGFPAGLYFVRPSVRLPVP